MKETIDIYLFRRKFEKMGLQNQFSYDALGVIFDYLEDLEEKLGQEFELDPISVCHDFTEFEDLEDFQEDYGKDYETIEDIESETIVLPVTDESFVIVNF